MPTILIIEDRPVDRTFLTTLLETAGFDVLAASDGEEGLGLLVERRPDLVISDILMPTANGYELVRRMRDIPGLASTPVIFYTATYHEREARALGARCGVVDILTRPTAPDVVLAKVNAALALTGPASPTAADAPPVDEARLPVVTAGPASTQAEVEASRQRMAAVAEVSHELAMERDLRALLQNVCDKARRVTLAQYAVIGLRDDSLASVETMVTSGIDAAQKPQIDIVPFADGILNAVVRDRRPIRWRWQGPADWVDARQNSDSQPSLVTFLCVPIASPTRVYGWLGQWNKLGAEAFDDLDEQIAVTLGTHAGIAYENAQLYHDLERHATGLEQQVAERRRAEERLYERSRLTALSSDIGGALIAGASVGDMLARCAQAFVHHVDAAAIEVWGAMDGRDVLELQTEWGSPAPAAGVSRLISTDTSEVGMLARNRTAYATNQVVGDPLVREQVWAQTEAILAFAGFPLLVDRRLVAVLTVYSKTPFSDDQLAVMAVVADQMALGLERRRMEAERIATLERTEFALAAANMGVWEVDVATRRVTWSDTTASMFDSPSPDAPVDRQALMTLVHPDDRAGVSSALERAEHDGIDVQVQFRTHWQRERVRWVESHARVVHDAQREPVRIVGVAINVTERKLLEDQLRQAQKMEAVGQLAGGVAHNFNNLLTAILGYATVVSDQMADTDPSKKDLERILAAGDRAAGLTRQLMAFSRKEVLEPASIDLNHLIVETGSLLKHLIGEHIELVVEPAPTACRVWADQVQVEQVVMNLAINARDAMPAGGRLTLRAAPVRLTAEEAATLDELEAGPYLTITVTDTGVGMTAETKQHAFEPFYTTKERGQGTGLGLATVLGIMRQSGGRVNLESEPGRGAVFTLYFPPAKQMVPVERPTVPPPARGGAETVLVIEDEEAVRCLVRVLLERAGYRVIDAECADQGESLFLENPDAIDLVISDVVMPGTSGPSLLKKLTAHHPGLKALFISGYPAGESGYLEEETEEDRLLTGEFAFLQKPFSAVNLVRKVRQVLDR